MIHGKRKGLVSSTQITVDLRYGDGTIVHNVDTKLLKHLQPFRFCLLSLHTCLRQRCCLHRMCLRQGNWVVSEGWLGRVLSCREEVVLRFDDDSQVSSGARPLWTLHNI